MFNEFIAKIVAQEENNAARLELQSASVSDEAVDALVAKKDNLVYFKLSEEALCGRRLKMLVRGFGKGSQEYGYVKSLIVRTLGILLYPKLLK
jgi:hypothetical protein